MNMHSKRILVRAAMSLALAAGFDLGAQETGATNSLNRFNFSARAAYGITAQFKSVATISAGAAPRYTPNYAPYNYDNGYVLTDASGNAGGQTWYWGYDSASQVSGNNILMSRSTTVSAGSDSTLDSRPGFGGEISFNRLLLTREDARIGLEVGLSYLNLGLSGDSLSTATTTRTTDAYPFTPGTTPPAAPPAYQGTYNGPGFLLGASPSSSLTEVLASAAVSGHQKFDANLIGFRVGPYVEFPLIDRIGMSLSAGFALAWVSSTASWTDNVTQPGGGFSTLSGSGSDSRLLYGGYLGGLITVQISEHWSAGAGAQYQNLGNYQTSASGRTVEVNFTKGIYAVLSVGYSF